MKNDAKIFCANGVIPESSPSNKIFCAKRGSANAQVIHSLYFHWKNGAITSKNYNTALARYLFGTG